MGMGGMMAGTGIIGMIVWIVILGLLFYGIYLLIAKISRKPKEASSDDDSLRILKERLARGEINEEAYERLKKIIKEE